MHSGPYYHEASVFLPDEFHHLPTFCALYRRLLIGPALMTPFKLWTVDGDLTMLRISAEMNTSLFRSHDHAYVGDIDRTYHC